MQDLRCSGVISESSQCLQGGTSLSPTFNIITINMRKLVLFFLYIDMLNSFWEGKRNCQDDFR